MRISPDQGMSGGMDWEMDSRSDQGTDPGSSRGFDGGNDRGMGRAGYQAREPEAASPGDARDLTLGMTALLGIFLAVVLVCAVFFGFGYSTGRTLHATKRAAVIASAPPPASGAGAATPGTANTSSPANAAANTAVPPSQDEAPHGVAAPLLMAAQPAAKPSAGAPLSPEDVASRTFSPSSQGAMRTSNSAAPYAAPTRRLGAAPYVSAGSPGAPVDLALRGDAGSGAAGGVMVQIAAVVHPGDADMLARALRSSGYAASVRTEPQDKFLHVQIGPFASRDQAKAMRARLQGDGYNAFLKP